ncbi:chemotaxis protein CheW [Shewanella violacea]|uniref:CheW domain protein n=1 Tax=Shewanella violacea (strain JCM 10179 / CIP 106290 / LMG 19151 / DSS12) TaxID=637905 RepID=D4ZIC8_SHEVD|nr:chemotaxis protein CheW [Shewanella violacea]BAJ01427.1 CheW domain protein [Shewanella violacea DSS12]
MTSLVDKAVSDYFNILLTEVEEQAETEQGGVAKLGAIEINVKTVSASSSQDGIVPRLAKVVERRTRSSTLTKPKLKEIEPQLDKQALEQLLAPVLKEKVKPKTKSQVKVKVSQKEKLVDLKPVVEIKSKQAIVVENELEVNQDIAIQQQVAVTPPKVTKDLLESLDDEFQVLFFKVAGLTLAVPLVSLGGIVKLERLNHIMGRPDWYKGVQTHRGTQLNVVDTCAWVMPEKYDSNLAETVNYQYVVLLEDSNWGLTCESLVNSVKIKKSAVNWRSNLGKRPWLAGVVREQMCGILHVHALIELLNSGLSSQDPVG